MDEQPTEVRLTWGGRVFFTVMVVGGIAMVPVGLAVHPVSASAILPLIYLAVYTQIAALLPIRWSRGLQHIFTPPLLAAGLFAPGGGVALITWVALYDGRRPGAGRPLWLLAALRGAIALAHGSASIIVSLLPSGHAWDLPIRTVVYSVLIVSINYPLTATGFALMHRTSVLGELRQNIGLSTIRSILVLGFSGGILYEILQAPSGYFMALGLIALLLAVRANIEDSQKQARLRIQTLELAAAALDARDSYTESHSARVAALAERIASVLGLTFRDIEVIRTAALLHDVGKIGIPDAILNKPGRLDDSERAIMNRHPEIGADLIQRHDALADVSPHVRSHHERWDGTGYPDGLRGDDIPIGARIIAVADAFDTLTGIRVYKPTKVGLEDAVDDIVLRSGTWYDPAVVRAVEQVLMPERGGLTQAPGLKRPRLRGQLLIASNAVSSVGDPLTTVALVATAAVSTHSPLAVAAIYVLKAVTTLAVALALGDIGDRLPRRSVAVAADIVRAGVLIGYGVVFALGRIELLLAVVLIHSAATAVGVPTRQAAASDLWSAASLPRALAWIASTNSIAGVIGYAIAGVLVGINVGMSRLLFVDAATFLVAGLLMVAVGGTSSGVAGPRLRLAAVSVLRLQGLREQLVLTGVAGFAAGMSFPALVFVATDLVGYKAAAGLYSWLEVALAAGVACGSLVAGRLVARGLVRAELVGLLVMGVACLGVGVSGILSLTFVGIFVASVGSAVYIVANQAAVLNAAPQAERAAAMTMRFTSGYIASLVGTAVGAMTTVLVSGQGTYMAIGVVLVGSVVVGAIAFARRRTRDGEPIGSRSVPTPIDAP